MSAPLVIAISKGRTVKSLLPLFARAGIDTTSLAADDRTLIRDSNDLRFLLLKADDVPTYVEYGTADLGICGRDVLRERGSDLLVPLDLEIGRCKMIVAAKRGTAKDASASSMPRVATKYPVQTAAHFAARGAQAEIIALSGSVELAAITGLADFVVDLVETGETLRLNGLEIVAEVSTVTTVLVVNRAAYKLRRSEISALVDRLRASHGAPPSPALT